MAKATARPAITDSNADSYNIDHNIVTDDAQLPDTLGDPEGSENRGKLQAIPFYLLDTFMLKDGKLVPTPSAIMALQVQCKELIDGSRALANAQANEKLDTVAGPVRDTIAAITALDGSVGVNTAYVMMRSAVSLITDAVHWANTKSAISVWAHSSRNSNVEMREGTLERYEEAMAKVQVALLSFFAFERGLTDGNFKPGYNLKNAVYSTLSIAAWKKQKDLLVADAKPLTADDVSKTNKSMLEQMNFNN